MRLDSAALSTVTARGGTDHLAISYGISNGTPGTTPRQILFCILPPHPRPASLVGISLKPAALGLICSLTMFTSPPPRHFIAVFTVFLEPLTLPFLVSQRALSWVAHVGSPCVAALRSAITTGSSIAWRHLWHISLRGTPCMQGRSFSLLLMSASWGRPAPTRCSFVHHDYLPRVGGSNPVGHACAWRFR
jgi:hypothetical protein